MRHLLSVCLVLALAACQASLPPLPAWQSSEGRDSAQLGQIRDLASGLLMGGAWGVAFLGPPLAQWILDQSNLRIAFVSSGVLLLISGALIAFLPRHAGAMNPVTKP